MPARIRPNKLVVSSGRTLTWLSPDLFRPVAELQAVPESHALLPAVAHNGQSGYLQVRGFDLDGEANFDATIEIHSYAPIRDFDEAAHASKRRPRLIAPVYADLAVDRVSVNFA
jgi:hypothetical protein